MKTTGRCLCGAIQYQDEGESRGDGALPLRELSPPDILAHRDIRDGTRSSLRFTHGQPKEYASTSGVRRSFCGACGSPIAYRSERNPTVIDLFAGNAGRSRHRQSNLPHARGGTASVVRGAG